VVFGSRRWVARQIGEVADRTRSARILEIGSGRRDLGQDAYSFGELFDGENEDNGENEFVRSDVNADYGHLRVDVTTMDFVDEWDVILCVSVLEHVPDLADLPRAVGAIHRALKPGGTAVIVVPMLFPYHDEPHDYWRFTAYGMRSLLGEFDSIDVRSRGPRRLPFTTLAIARKSN
jgi:SAM-dependent methyltransferase